MILTSNQIESFHQNGFLLLDNFFDQKELNDFRDAVTKIIRVNLLKASKDDHPEINTSDLVGKELHEGITALEKVDHGFIADVYDTISFIPQFLRITSKVEISQCINQLTDRDLNSPTYIDQSRCRIDQPFDPYNRMVPWHQEVVYYVPGSDFVQTWAPLIIDATIVNGTIQICPASHNEIAKQSYHEGEGDDYRYIVDEDVIKKYNPISLEMKLGQLLIFDSKLIHRSGKNESSQTRYSLVGINHNIANEQFTPPRFVVKNRDKIMNDYYKELQPSEQDI